MSQVVLKQEKGLIRKSCHMKCEVCVFSVVKIWGFVSEKLENKDREKAKTIGSKTLQMKNSKNTLYT